MNKQLQLSQNLIKFINNSPTSYHVRENASKILAKNGFQELDLKEKWQLDKEGSYYIQKNSALIAFQIGKGEIASDGFKIIAAHTDSPGIKIKPQAEILTKKSYLKLNTEIYGSPILNTYFDRPLSIAGSVSLKSANLLYPTCQLIDFKKPILLIPNLAIHLDKDNNKKSKKIDEQKELLPLLSIVDKEIKKEGYLIELIADNLAVSSEQVLAYDLFLYDTQEGEILGLNNEFISAARLDDQAMVYAGLIALVKKEVAQATNILVLFDNEEIGSKTIVGADSPFLANVLERIVLAFTAERESYFRSLENSFIISADMAHALHPNYLDKYDPTNQVIINNGLVIKTSANKSYTTDADTSSVCLRLCKQMSLPVQFFVNHSKEKGGSTLGPLNTTQLAVRTLDIGNPLLAMHSIRELAGVKDLYDITKFLQGYYSL